MKPGRWISSSLLLISLCAISVSAMELGGFDVEIGTGAYPDDGSWEQPSAPLPPPGEGDFEGFYPQEIAPPQQNTPPIEEAPEPPFYGELQENQINRGGVWPEYSPGSPGVPAPNPGDWREETTPVPRLPSPTPELKLSPTPTPSPTPSPTPKPTPPPKKKKQKKRKATAPEKPWRYYRRGEKKEKGQIGEIEEFIYPVEGSLDKTKITVKGEGRFAILSLRLNGKELPWHWEGSSIVIEKEEIPGDSEIKMLVQRWQFREDT